MVTHLHVQNSSGNKPEPLANTLCSHKIEKPQHKVLKTEYHRIIESQTDWG